MCSSISKVATVRDLYRTVNAVTEAQGPEVICDQTVQMHVHMHACMHV